MLRLFCDRRLKPARYYVAEEEESMFIPAEMLKCVAFLYGKQNNQLKPAGTVFFVALSMPEVEAHAPYAITARHVIESIDKNGQDDIVYMRLNRTEGGTELIRTKVKHWVFHPDPKVDVAVLGFNPCQKEFDAQVFSSQSFATDEALKDESPIGPGHDVFITGLFEAHVGNARNIPIVRIGNIAALAGEPIKTKRGDVIAHLIEARSINGLSGSPVFVSLGHVRKVHGRLGFDTGGAGIYYLFGLIHGHYDEHLRKGLLDERINMGIALVVPVQQIIEALNQPRVADRRNAMREEIMAKRNLPTEDASLLARSVVEAAIGEPLTPPKKKARKAPKKAKKRATR